MQRYVLFAGDEYYPAGGWDARAFTPSRQRGDDVFVNPVHLSEDERELAALMSALPTPYSEAVAFRASVESDDED